MLFDFELQDQIVGRTRFCERPAHKVKDIKVIGGTKNPKIDKIKQLKPDFVIASKEENRKRDVEELRGFTHVHVTDVKTVKDAMASIHELGRLLGREKQASKILSAVKREMGRIPLIKPATAAYFIWRKPWMSVGGDTYINDVMQQWGLENIYAEEKRYPEIILEKLADAQPEFILLSSEPFPFKEKHVQEVVQCCPNSSVVLIDGQWFSWYGSRMVEAFGELNEWRAVIKGESGSV